MVEWWLLRKYCPGFPVLPFYYMHDSANCRELKIALILSLCLCKKFGNPYCGVVVLVCSCRLAVLPFWLVTEVLERFINKRSGLLLVVSPALLGTWETPEWKLWLANSISSNSSSCFLLCRWQKEEEPFLIILTWALHDSEKNSFVKVKKWLNILKREVLGRHIHQDQCFWHCISKAKKAKQLKF